MDWKGLPDRKRPRRFEKICVRVEGEHAELYRALVNNGKDVSKILRPAIERELLKVKRTS
jgi:hypothetical protein